MLLVDTGRQAELATLREQSAADNAELAKLEAARKALTKQLAEAQRLCAAAGEVGTRWQKWRAWVMGLASGMCCEGAVAVTCRSFAHDACCCLGRMAPNAPTDKRASSPMLSRAVPPAVPPRNAYEYGDATSRSKSSSPQSSIGARAPAWTRCSTTSTSLRV